MVIYFDQLSKADYAALLRYARWLGVTTKGTTASGEGRRKLAMRVARALKQGSAAK